jgi:tetratricopeptide (TPR) repeat protein
MTILSFNAQLACAAEPEFDVVYPFINATNTTLVLEPYLQRSFLAFLENNSVQAVLGEDGLPIVYFSQEPRFGCSGFCSNITMNNYILGSKSLNLSGISAEQVMEEMMVIGDSGIEGSIDTINAIRESLGSDPEALASFERYLLEQQEGLLRGTYYDERYEDVWDYALSGIQGNPSLYNNLVNNLRMENMQGAVDKLEEYLQGNFDINGAFDMENLYSALENGQLGSMQTEEFMQNVLKRIAENENLKIDMDKFDMEGLSDLLKTDEFREMMEKASEAMKNNPEAFDKLQDIAKEMMERPETKEVFKEALKEMMEKSDWETIKNLMEAFSKMENKQELMETLMKSAGEYMKEMVESGQMDELTKMMNDPALKDMMAEASQYFSQEMAESIWDWIKETPIEVAYVVALIAIIATLLILMKLRL